MCLSVSLGRFSLARLVKQKTCSDDNLILSYSFVVLSWSFLNNNLKPFPSATMLIGPLPEKTHSPSPNPPIENRQSTDTMGHPFTLPLLSFLSGSTVPLGAYVHYPVISTDMIGRVRDGVWGVESGSEAGTGGEGEGGGGGEVGDGGGDGADEKKSGGGLKGWRRLGKLAYVYKCHDLYTWLSSCRLIGGTTLV